MVLAVALKKLALSNCFAPQNHVDISITRQKSTISGLKARPRVRPRQRLAQWRQQEVCLEARNQKQALACSAPQQRQQQDQLGRLAPRAGFLEEFQAANRPNRAVLILALGFLGLRLLRRKPNQHQVEDSLAATQRHNSSSSSRSRSRNRQVVGFLGRQRPILKQLLQQPEVCLDNHKQQPRVVCCKFTIPSHPASACAF